MAILKFWGTSGQWAEVPDPGKGDAGYTPMRHRMQPGALGLGSRADTKGGGEEAGGGARFGNKRRGPVS